MVGATWEDQRKNVPTVGFDKPSEH
jgi:hypothetical protein